MPVLSDEDGYVVFATELEAQKEIVDPQITRLRQFLDGEREDEDAIEVEEYVVAVILHSNGKIVDKDGKYFGPKCYSLDVFINAKRSEVRSRIRSRANKDTEFAIAKLFRRNKITGWRRHRQVRIQKSGVRIFKVRPDFVFPKQRLALFVEGCF